MSVKIRRIDIQNYKGIDTFSMTFPKPLISSDPDILVIGSQNGLGKTSILECCSMLLLCLTFDQIDINLSYQRTNIDIPDLLIKADSETAIIGGEIVLGSESFFPTIEIKRDGMLTNKSKINYLQKNLFIHNKKFFINFLNTICGFNTNPFIANKLLLFHSYRKIKEGNPELGRLVKRSFSFSSKISSYYDFYLSEFKMNILHSMMKNVDLFENLEYDSPDDTLNKLNELMKYYAKGKISKLRPSSDNTIDFRVVPINGEKSFSFDGLSSGQKEIISTLFLIWLHTKNNPSIVFIDEPELHLNAQWHRSFVNKLISLAPNNQYILATHSEDVMSSVDKDRRILLFDDQDENND
jgi:predicted ATP-dependent endonuclease of OLD family